MKRVFWNVKKKAFLRKYMYFSKSIFLTRY